MPAPPVIGIVGSHGAYGRWLREFLATRMGLEVLGADPADPAGLDPAALLERSDVLVFSVPIRHTAATIDEYARIAGGREHRQLWLDLTSIKAAPVAAMLRSRAEVAGLHPMTAPPKGPTLKGRVLVVCEARLARWRGWLRELLDALEAQCVHSDPDRHDRVMALVQAMVHATHLAQAGVLRQHAAGLGSLEGLMPYRSASFELDAAVMARILSLNPAIYEDIQFENPHVPGVLDALAGELARLRDAVRRGGDEGRSGFRRHFLLDNREAFGAGALREGNHGFERLAWLLADLAETRTLSVHLPRDEPGALRRLLHVFERLGISLSSIHSARTPEGEVHFRIGFAAALAPELLLEAGRRIEHEGIGRLL
ncbi:prephenate dehydrogenase [Luteimonas sp. RD2P54]|uniref:Prephenate dehydrogenase n=1 Tax=Luteimonas endophytica TaxID=3042023 RepID=A0ABT6J7Q6_9GAMM|nr:prephenate dehydrogenase [Luteimonas endophytica]MDH5822856.1 prephenate dehydrogenase [Luteimonas endophytica]